MLLPQEQEDQAHFSPLLTVLENFMWILSFMQASSMKPSQINLLQFC